MTGIAADPRSGLHLAERAHREGAVTAPLERSNYDVGVSFVVHGGEPEARLLVQLIEMVTLDAGSLASPLTVTLTERAA